MTAPRTTADEWDLAVAAGLIRVGAAVALWRRRPALIRMSGGTPDDSVLRAVFHYFAARDLALGLATLASTRPGGDVRRLLVVSGAFDTVDGGLIGTLVARGRLKRLQGLGAAALAAGTAASEYAAAWRLGRAVRS